MNQEFSLLDIARLLWKNSKTILLAGFIAALITTGITLLMDNYYSATTSFYAASPELSNPSPLGTTDNSQNIYGNDHDIDRLLSIAKSNKLLLFLINEFDLYEHYKINKDGKKAKYKIREKLLDLYKIQKTKYNAITLEIEDKDPEIAAMMANNARDKIGELAMNIIKDSQKKTLDNSYHSIAEKEKILRMFNDSLRILKNKYGVIDIGSQSEVLASNSSEINLSLNQMQGTLVAMIELGLPQDSINNVKAKISGLKSKKKEIDSQLKSFSEGSASIQALESQVGIFRSQIGFTKEKYKQLLATYNAPFATIHIVEEAEAPVMKSRPKRMILVLIAAIIASLLALFFILLKESLRDFSLD